MKLKLRLRGASASNGAAKPSGSTSLQATQPIIKSRKPGVRFDLSPKDKQQLAADPRGKQKQHKNLNLPPSLLQDPAFSPDPFAHPYNYLTGQEESIQIWAREPPPGHPALRRGVAAQGQGQRLRRPPPQGDRTRPQPQQQPSTSISTSGLDNGHANGPFKVAVASGGVGGDSSNNNNRDDAEKVKDLTDVVSLASLPLVPPPPNSPMLVSNWKGSAPGPPPPPLSLDTPAAAKIATTKDPAIVPEPVIEPRNGLVRRLGSVLTRKKSWGKHKGSKSHDGHVSIAKLDEATTPTRRLQRHNSAPGGPERAPQRQAQAPLIGAKGGDTSGSADRTAPVADSADRHDTAPAAPLKKKRDLLDSIDELDESNLFGLSLHHDGPYEAVRSLIASPPRMPLGFENDGRLYEYHERMLKSSGHLYELPKAPDGISLNLSPGQLLPRNFKREKRKAPRFRNVVSPVDPVIEVSATQVRVKPGVPPRHQNFNQIPFHNQNPTGKNARHSRMHRAADDNPLDGPPIDTSYIIGLAMMQGQDEADEEEPVTQEPEPIQAVQVKETQHEVSEDVEFDPYDPKNFSEIAHCNVVDQPSYEAPDLEFDEDTDVPSYPPPPTSTQSHFSEEEFHAKRASVAEGNRQFEGLPAGVQYLPPEPSPDAAVTRHRTPSPPPGHRLAPASSEETLVCRDDEPADTTLVTDPLPEANAKKDEITSAAVAKVGEALSVQIDAEATRRQNELEQNKETAVIGAITPTENELVDDPTQAQHGIDDVDHASKSNIYTQQARYDKQLPPNPSSPLPDHPPPEYTDDMAVVVPVQLAYQATSDVPYVPPHQRSSFPHPLSGSEKRKSANAGLQRSDSLSTQLSQRSSVGSHQSVSSTKGDHGHSTMSGPGKPIVYGAVVKTSSTAGHASSSGHQPPQKKPSSSSSSSSKSKQYQPMVILPTLSSSFEHEYNRYPNPESKKRPAPTPQQLSVSRSQNRSGSGSGVSRSQLAPIQEVPEHTGRGVETSGSEHSRRSDRDRERESSRKRRKEEGPPYGTGGSYHRIEVGQVYPKHLLPPRSTPQRPSPQAQYAAPRFEGIPPSLQPSNRSYASSQPQQSRPEHSFENRDRMPPPPQRSQESVPRQRDAPSSSSSHDRPKESYDFSPRSSEESERPPLRVMNALSQLAEGDGSSDGHGRRPHPGIQNQPVAPSPSPQPPAATLPPPSSSRPFTPPEQQYRTRTSPDNASSIRPEDSASNRARSVTSYAPSSAGNHNLRLPPSNRHMPKKLVMPAPLQPQQQSIALQQVANTSQLYGNIFRPRPQAPASVASSNAPGMAPRVSPNSIGSSNGGGSGPMSIMSGNSREPSPPNILPPILSQDYKPPDGATQRKLKKRTSLPPPSSRVGSVSPNEALNFQPVILPPAEKPKPKQAMKLSKRRTNL
ncbi:hypothetical protein BKA70DRAFT_316691 [Coprinopsis sp. MPI-PUGE-AT-0042]|nr:hypothetical protein BKA70DRAFT_316691 [Coprinopsis sp. MPI-PUGE-AT-0042]